MASATSITELEKILKHAISQGTSDVHMCEWEYVRFRTSGALDPLEQAGKINKDLLRKIALQLYNWDEKLLENFVKTRDDDFAYVSLDGTPFRVNGFFTLGRMAFVLRRIEKDSKDMSELGMPEGVEKVLTAKQGLFLVTGPTGSGKSTSMVSIIDKINENRDEHVITIEDPVEFIFTNKKSTFSQRQVGPDTKGFLNAIRGAMREDPDIVVIGEMRDKETVEAAIGLAETGHLVFSTLHTSGSVQTISRLVQFFHPDLQYQMKSRLADSLLGVLSQRLLKRRDKPGRVALYELMYVTPGIGNLIRSGDLIQINNAILMWQSDGMISMKMFGKDLEDRGIIDRDDYMCFFTNDQDS